MLDVLARNWWALALQGVVAILFGLAALIWPGLTLTALVLLFGAYALVDGVFAAVAALARAGRERRWWVLLLEGLLGIAAYAGLVASPRPRRPRNRKASASSRAPKRIA